MLGCLVACPAVCRFVGRSLACLTPDCLCGLRLSLQITHLRPRLRLASSFSSITAHTHNNREANSNSTNFSPFVPVFCSDLVCVVSCSFFAHASVPRDQLLWYQHLPRHIERASEALRQGHSPPGRHDSTVLAPLSSLHSLFTLFNTFASLCAS